MLPEERGVGREGTPPLYCWKGRVGGRLLKVEQTLFAIGWLERHNSHLFTALPLSTCLPWLQDTMHSKMAGVIQQLMARNGRLIVIANEEDDEMVDIVAGKYPIIAGEGEEASVGCGVGWGRLGIVGAGGVECHPARLALARAPQLRSADLPSCPLPHPPLQCPAWTTPCSPSSTSCPCSSSPTTSPACAATTWTSPATW